MKKFYGLILSALLSLTPSSAAAQTKPASSSRKLTEYKVQMTFQSQDRKAVESFNERLRNRYKTEIIRGNFGYSIEITTSSALSKSNLERVLEEDLNKINPDKSNPIGCEALKLEDISKEEGIRKTAREMMKAMRSEDLESLATFFSGQVYALERDRSFTRDEVKAHFKREFSDKDYERMEQLSDQIDDKDLVVYPPERLPTIYGSVGGSPFPKNPKYVYKEDEFGLFLWTKSGRNYADFERYFFVIQNAGKGWKINAIAGPELYTPSEWEDISQIKKEISGIMSEQISENLEEYMSHFENPIYNLENGKPISLSQAKDHIEKSFESRDYTQFKKVDLIDENELRFYIPKRFGELFTKVSPRELLNGVKSKKPVYIPKADEYGVRIPIRKGVGYPFDELFFSFRKINGRFKVVGSGG